MPEMRRIDLSGPTIGQRLMAVAECERETVELMYRVNGAEGVPVVQIAGRLAAAANARAELFEAMADERARRVCPALSEHAPPAPLERLPAGEIEARLIDTIEQRDRIVAGEWRGEPGPAAMSARAFAHCVIELVQQGDG